MIDWIYIESAIESLTGGDISDCKVIVNQQDFLLAVENTTPSLNQAELNRYEAVRKQFSLTKQSGV